MSAQAEFYVPTGGGWSGGGKAVLDCFRFAAERHPQISFERGAIDIVNRNFPPKRTRKPFILIPQNAWPWDGPRYGAQEFARVAALRVASEIAMRRATGVIRAGGSIPRRGRCAPGLLPNPLDPGFERALEDSLAICPPVDEPYLVSVGSFNSYRGFEQLLAAYRRYRSSGADLALHLVGGGNPRYAARIKGLCQDLPGVTIHFGGASRPECLAWLRHAAAAVLPSHVETSPMSLLEALAVQPRVIASEIAGHRDIVPEGTPHPEYYAVTDSEQLARRLPTSAESRELSHPLAEQEVREAGRERWSRLLIDKLMWITQEGQE